MMLLSKLKTPQPPIVTSENSWDEMTRSDAHRRAMQQDILNHFKDSPMGDQHMRMLRDRFQAALKHFNEKGQLWLKPQKLSQKLAAVRQVDTRMEFERRFLYNNPGMVRNRAVNFESFDKKQNF